MKNALPQQKSNKTDKAGKAAAGIKTSALLLKVLRATQPVSRVELARRLKVNRSTVSDLLNPLISAGVIREQTAKNYSDDSGSRVQGRPRIELSFDDERDFFVGINLGVRHTQVGLTTLGGKSLGEVEFATPLSPDAALSEVKKHIESLCREITGRTLRTVGVSVPGPTDAGRSKLLYAPNLGWSEVAVAAALESACPTPKNNSKGKKVPVIVENDATAAALYEARLRMKKTNDNVLTDFILVRSGTGIGVGLVLGGEIYRGNGRGLGVAGEFGHMTIMAGGKTCVCGNRGCWEKYASASAAAELYAGDRANNLIAKQPLRFVEIVSRAEAGEIRAQRTLERIGEYLGIGIANVISGVGVTRVVVSGRLVYGWKFLNPSLRKAIERSLAGRLSGWSVECGEPKGSALGGAFDIAVQEFLTMDILDF